MIVSRTRSNMFWTSGGLFLALLCLGGSQSLYDLQWLPCQFVDENVYKMFDKKKNESYIETEFIYRKAVLQFGNVGDKPLHPTITFLVTASKVDMRRYLKGTKDKLQCKIRRYSIGSSVTRWPTTGAQEHNVWFTSTIRHSENSFAITTFLKHTTEAPAEEQMDFLQWKTINDTDLLTTSAVMYVLTRTPSVDVALLKEPILDCQFGVDHKAPHVTVEWILQKHGERSVLFSYSSRTGKSEGRGVAIGTIAAGNASFKLPSTSKQSQGTYICSVKVPPLNGNQDIPLTLSEQPRVSINVDSTLSVVRGQSQKLICDAEGYYPREANIKWYRESPGDSPSPSFLNNVLFSSHKHHHDGTYSHSAFFILHPSVNDSGYKYTCTVSHKSLLTPIHKSFSLVVTDPESTLWNATVILSIIAILVILCYMLPQYLRGKKAPIKFSPAAVFNKIMRKRGVCCEV